ncbi:MAG: hypothetical protein HKM24_05965 [Gammaproteobacteria bacterium]|nr:hypothetical protein [Gammaproteobacteria bacterium]
MSGFSFIEQHFVPCRVVTRSTEYLTPAVQAIEEHPDSVRFPLKFDLPDRPLGFAEVTHSLVSYDPSLNPDDERYVVTGTSYVTRNDGIFVWLEPEKVVSTLHNDAVGHLVVFNPIRESPIDDKTLRDWIKVEQQLQFARLAGMLEMVYAARFDEQRKDNRDICDSRDQTGTA